jgi:excisionase family DNA binding protein
MKNLEGRNLITVQEAAAFLKVSVQTMYNLKCKGKIRGYNLGGAKRGKLYFLENDIIALVMGTAI